MAGDTDGIADVVGRRFGRRGDAPKQKHCHAHPPQQHRAPDSIAPRLLRSHDRQMQLAVTSWKCAKSTDETTITALFDLICASCAGVSVTR